MNILIVKLSAIGDVIHTLPSLSMLRRLWPDARISWAVEEAAADLLVDHPELDRLIISRRKTWWANLRRGIVAEPLREIRAFFAELRAEQYDIVIDFHGLLKSALLVLLSGGKRKIGYASLQEGSGLFYNEKIPEDMVKHAVDRYLDFVRYLAGTEHKNLDDWTPEFKMAIGEKEDKHITELLAQSAGQKTTPPFIAVSPVAFWRTKLWEDEKFALLGDRIQSELHMRVVLTGADAERLEQVGKRMKTRAINLGGKTSLRELGALYRRAALLVTTDSGPMHLAAAVGTPVVALFGPTDPARTGPYGANHRVVRRGLPCSPCFKKECPDPRCMSEIAVEEVFDAVRGLLDQ